MSARIIRESREPSQIIDFLSRTALFVAVEVSSLFVSIREIRGYRLSTLSHYLWRGCLYPSDTLQIPFGYLSDALRTGWLPTGSKGT